MSVFDITNRCNLKCIYCCRGESLNKQVDEVSTEDVLNTIHINYICLFEYLFISS